MAVITKMPSIEIESVPEFDGGEYNGWLECKGHVPPADFLAALGEQWQLNCSESEVKHVWIRYVPFRDNGAYIGMVATYARPHSRGATPRTQVERSKCAEVHECPSTT